MGERVWGDTLLLPPDSTGRSFHNVITDRCVPVQPDGTIRAADAFDVFPVAMLMGADAS